MQLIFFILFFIAVGAVALLSGFGVTIGAHRLYSHKAFKARWPLKLGLIVLQTVAGQVSMYPNFLYEVYQNRYRTLIRLTTNYYRS